MTRVLVHGALAGHPEAAATGRMITLDARQSHHLVRVLRLVVGARLEICDGAGGRCEAVIESADPKASVLRLLEPITRLTESPLAITLAQCLSTADKMDWTIEKAVELGAHRIMPLASERSQVRLDAARAARKHEHWLRIVESACMQSDRAWLPTLDELMSFTRFVDEADDRARRMILAPGAATPLAAMPVDGSQAVIIAVGPESGFSTEELSRAVSRGFEPVSLGPRTLRTETAGLAAIAVLQALAGDFCASTPATE